MDWKLGAVSLIKTTYTNYIYFDGIEYTKSLSTGEQIKKKKRWTWLQDLVRFKLLPDPVVELRNNLKTTGIATK